MDAHDAPEGARGEVAPQDPPWVSVPGMSTVEQAEMFGTIAASAPAGVIASDIAGRVIWVNPIAAEMFGWTREELIGQLFTVVLPPETHEQILRLRQRILTGEHTASFVTRGMRRDGEVFDLEATPGIRRDATGQPLGTNMMLRDVTEELRVRRELDEALARSRARFDQSANPQALLDIEGRFVQVNDAACDLLGWPRGELLGRDSTEIIHPSEPQLVRRRLGLLRDGHLRAATYDTIGLRKDGSRVPLQIDITAVRDEEGHAYEFAALARDLTDLHEAQRLLTSQEAFFRGLNRESSDATLVADAHGRLVYVTPSTTQVLGYDPEALVDVLGEKIVHPDDLETIAEQRRRLRESAGARERFRVRLLGPDGDTRWFEATVTNCLEDPDINGLVINLRDVAAEMAAQEALRESEARYRAIAHTAQEGILAVSLDGDILFANERLTDILALPLDEVYALGREGVFSRGEVGAAARRLVRRPAGDGPERFDIEYLHPRGDTRVLSVSASALRSEDGTLLGSLAMVSDVTEQRSAEALLRHQAVHDALTGLPNRVLFLDRLGTARARQQRSGSRGIAVLFLDLDDFKDVNDTHGHVVGDRVLAEVAARLADAVRDTDTVARIGGDEFAVICEDADAASATQVASRIQKCLEPPVDVDGLRLATRASVGIALAPPHEVADLLRLADRAMYLAKAADDLSICVYDDEAE